MQELWVAARAGGFHSKQRAGPWCHTRDGSELIATPSELGPAQSGAPGPNAPD